MSRSSPKLFLSLIEVRAIVLDYWCGQLQCFLIVALKGGVESHGSLSGIMKPLPVDRVVTVKRFRLCQAHGTVENCANMQNVHEAMMSQESAKVTPQVPAL